MTITRIPNVYRPGIGGGGPLRWQDDMIGVLPRAVFAFFEGKANEEQLGLVREYMEYYVKAPCWQHGEAKELDALRKKIETLKTAKELHDFIWECMEIGLDPL